MSKKQRFAAVAVMIAGALFSWSGDLFAQEAQSSGKSPELSAEEEMLKAYQREYAFLMAQKDVLQRQKKTTLESLNRQQLAAQASIKDLEKRLIRGQIENEALFEQAQALETRRREEQGRLATLQASWKKAKRAFSDAESSLRFETERKEIDLTPPAKIAVRDVAEIGKRAVSLTDSASGWAEFSGAFMNREGNLVDGTIIRLGRVAAYGRSGGQLSILGPSENGVLKVIEEEKSGAAAKLTSGSLSAGSLVPAYIFESMSERAKVKKSVHWQDRVADLVPALFLAMLFFVVLWLFGSLARV